MVYIWYLLSIEAEKEMNFIYTQEFVILAAIWVSLAYLGTDIGRAWYRIKYFDKLIHFLGGLAITSFLYSNSFSIQNIFLLNIVLGLLFEYFQIFSSKIIKVKGFGFPEGFADVAFQLLGTFSYLKFIGLF